MMTDLWICQSVQNRGLKIWCIKHHELIEKDDMYIFAIFNKNQQHIGMIDIITIRRGNFQWAERGYFIHNQH
ncbi:TPA: hypothetical protein ACJHIH_002119 [Staphylococcus pseudintermedius]